MSPFLERIEIREGQTKLEIPEDHSINGPGKRVGKVFYNRQMGFNRDVSVCLFPALDLKGRTALDAMAGTGARGVRIANEAEGGFDIWINDAVPEAYEIIERNIELNDLENASPINEDLRCLLTKRVFDYVDIDPFGSPVPYLHSAIIGCKRNGILAATATDTAPLAGTYPKKCVRRYGARPLRCRFGHEVGLRILIGHIVREAAKYDRGVDPILCFYADHYFRVHLKMREGGGSADKSLDLLGFIEYETETGRRTLSKDPGPTNYGPLWIGPLFDPLILGSMESGIELAEPRRMEKMLETWRNELDIPFFYDSDEVSAILGMSPPPLDAILEKLGERGNVSRTHFSPTGFKTEMDFDELLDSFKELV